MTRITYVQYLMKYLKLNMVRRISCAYIFIKSIVFLDIRLYTCKMPNSMIWLKMLD